MAECFEVIFSNRAGPSENLLQNLWSNECSCSFGAIENGIASTRARFGKEYFCAIAIFILKLREQMSFVLKGLCIAFLSHVNTAAIHFVFLTSVLVVFC